MGAEHFCNPALFPGECIVCVGKPRPFVRVESWAGSADLPVEIIGRTPKRLRIRFLEDSRWHKSGEVRLVAPDVVRTPTTEKTR